MTTLQLSLPADHPAAQGHFPGNPMIPGAVLLSEAIGAIAASLGNAPSPCTIRAAKFLHPARPGDRVTIEFQELAGKVRFTCTVGEDTVMKGEVEWSPAPNAS